MLTKYRVHYTRMHGLIIYVACLKMEYIQIFILHTPGFLFLTFGLNKNLASQNIKATIRWKINRVEEDFHSWRAPSPIHLCNSDIFQLLVTHEALMIRRGLFCSKYLCQQRNQIRNWKFQWCSFLEHKKWNLKQKWSSFLSGLQQGDEHWQCQRCTQDVGKWDPGTWSLQSSGIFVSGTMATMVLLFVFGRNPGWIPLISWHQELKDGLTKLDKALWCQSITWKTSIWELRYGTPIMTIWWSIWWFDTLFLDYLFDWVFFRVELHH